jgi:arylsulfatase A-like enzyme
MRILFVDLDCLRSDHVGANGYHRNTTPNIDRVAAGGVTFTRAYCANSPCLPARASLFTARFGINNGIVAHHGTGERLRWTHEGHWRDPARPFFQHHLWSKGMKTVSFSCFHDRHNAWWFTAGWQELHTFTRKRGQETADEVNAAALPWLTAHAREDNWFLHVHYWDIHTHYRITQEWADRFRDDPPPAWPDQAAIDRHQRIYGPKTALDLFTLRDTSPTPVMPDAVRTVADFKKLVDGYDGAIAYADHHVGQLLQALDDAGVLEDTAVIITGDHGDSFGEHGQYTDHGIANEAVHNVPMIVKWPGLPARGRREELIYIMDVAPTVCELMGFPVPAGWDARSFAPALRGEEFRGWPYLVYDHGIYTFTRTVRTPDWMLMQVLHPGLYPYDDPVMLHDMKKDPHQQVNLAAQRPEVAGELSRCLADWRQEQVRKGGVPDPLEEMVPVGPFLYCKPEPFVERLRKTGRGHFADDLIRRLSRFHPEGFNPH